MAAMMVQTVDNFNVDDISFSSLRKNKMGGKAVYINLGPSKMYLQLPSMRAPFGLSSYTDEATKKTTYSLDLSFDAGLEYVQKKFQDLDEHIIKTVQANSVEWLGKKFNESVIREALYKPLVKESSKGDYPAMMKLKILTNRDTNAFVPEAYNRKRERVELDSLTKGQKVVCIIDISQIWFIDNKFGVTVRLQQVLFEPTKQLPSFAFQGVETASSDEEIEYEEVEEEVADE